LVVLAVIAALALLLYACSGSGSGKKQPVADGQSSSPAASQSSLPNNGGNSSQAASGGASGSSTAGGGASSGGPGGGSASGTAGGPTGTGGTGGTGATAGGPGSSATGSVTGGPGCQLTLSLNTAAAYANGDNPQFTVAVFNKGTSDCDVDVSPKSLVLNIYSGNDHVWSSADCTTVGKDVRGIAPGTAETVTYSWNRVRSAQGCPAGGTPVKLGMYFGVATLGPGTGPNAPSSQSQPKTFELKTGS
jgi:hypothetical protein